MIMENEGEDQRQWARKTATMGWIEMNELISLLELIEDECNISLRKTETKREKARDIIGQTPP